ncbi:MAG: hypothetical protein KIH64_013265 [Mycobacterium sp.]|nr:hypothetical protein [Mycobacterium sp.]
MCAENFGRSDKNPAQMPPRSIHSVGRVGALAVALGIGGALLGFTPVAAADNGDPAGPGQDSGRSSDSTHRRGGSPTASNTGASNIPESTAEAPATNSRSGRSGRSGRGSGDAESDRAVEPTQARNTNVPAPAVTRAPAAAVDPAPAIESDIAPAVVEEAAAVAVEPTMGDFSPVSGDGSAAGGAMVAPAEIAPIAEAAPVMTASEADVLSEGDADPAALLGEDGSGEPGAEPLAWAALAVTRREDLAGATPEVAAAAEVSTGEPVEPLAAAAGDLQAGTFNIPAVPSGCGTAVCTTLVTARPTLIKDIANAVVTAYGDAAGQAGGCGGSTCPASPANYIGAYTFNVIYALMGASFTGTPLPNTTVGSTVQALFSQPQILTFVSETVVAGNKFLSKLPQDVALTVGNAVGTFALNSLGNTTVANAFVPFLRALNIPTGTIQAGIFASAASSNVFAAILKSGNRQISPTGMQSALVTMLTTPGVQTQMAAAVTAAFNVLLGLNTQPSWVGEPTVSPTALADYVGQLGANALLPEDNPNNPALAATIGSAVQALFGNIGGTVATQAGAAFQAFLNAPGQNVPNILSTAIVNGFVAVLQKGAEQPIVPPFPNQPPLLPSLGPAAGYAVTGFVNAVLSTPSVTQGLGQFITQVVPGILDNQGIQDEIDTTVSALVATLVGGDLGDVVGPQIGAAVVTLLTDPTVSTALTTFVNTAVGTFLGSSGVVTQLANAAGTLATAQLEGTLADVKPQVEAALRASTDIQNGVNVGVTAATAGLLGNTALWADVDSTLSALVGTLLGDVEVQEALAKDVAAMVEKKYPGPVGEFLGAQLGAVAVSLATNPVVEAGLHGVVDTLFVDFWSSPGVVTAFSEAAGELAAAAVAGDLETVAPVVAASLQANPDVQTGVEVSLGAAMTEFLGDTALWAAVDQTLSAAVISLTTDPVVLAGLDNAVQGAVELLLGEPLGSVVGPQVGAAVVSLVSNPVVSSALLGVVDTLFSDFFSAPGVVDAFSAAASQWGLVLLTTLSLSSATKAAQDELKASPAIANGVDVSVTAAVAEFLGDTQLWAVVDQTVASLFTTILGDVEVQDALATQISNMVAAKIPEPLGSVVGDAVGAAVVSLVTNPIISNEVIALVDTVFSDFWGYPGVVTAFSEAAGTLAVAALEGDLDTVAPEVQAALRANPAVDTATQVAVGDAVTQLLSDTAVWTTVDATLSALVSGLLNDPVVEDALFQTVSSTVELLVGGPLGAEVGPQVAAAVVSLVTNPVVESALHGVVDTLFSDFFNTYGVIPAIAGAASELALVVVTGGDLTEAIAAAQAELKASPAIENGVDNSVTAAVAELLSDTALWAAVDQTVSGLVVTLLGDPLVQQALDQQVSAMVAAKIPGPLGVVVGDAVGAAVVSLATNPIVQSALGAVVDTLFTDFWGSPGVVTAFSEAAGTLAVAALVGDLDTVAPEVQAALRANPDVDAAVEVSVGAAVTELLSNQALWQTVDATLTALVAGLVSDPQVEDAIYQTVSSTVALLVGEPLGSVVGPQVATAVVSLVTNPVVGQALHDVVDTLVSDFFGAPGVVDAFASAAGQFAEILVTGGTLAEAEQAARDELKASPAVENGVDVSVTAAVAELLGDTELWAVVDQTVSSLAVTLLGDQAVQDALAAQVAAMVEAKIQGPLGPVVGEAVGAAVVSLVTNPAIQSGIGAVVDTLFTDFWGTPGVVTAFSEAAGTLAMAALVGDLSTVAPEVRASLQANPDVQAGVDGSVTAAVAELLGDTDLWTAVDTTLSALVSGLLHNPDIEDALYQTVSSTVALLVGGPLGPVVGDQVATAVVSLVTNPAIETGLHNFVDTLFSDFLGAPGVIDAIAGTAGGLALVAFTGGDVAAALKEAEQALRTNPDIDAGVDIAVTAGVSQLLSDTAVWSALDSTISALVAGLATDPEIDAALYQTVSATVSSLIGGELGAAVGPQVANAVVALVTDPAIAGGLHAFVDTLFSDFFGAPGVITALSEAAGTLASAAVYGNLDTVLPEVETAVRTNPDIDAAVGSAVSAGVSELLGDTAVWTSLDSIFSSLVGGLIADPVVQQALNAEISATVASLVGGELGAVVGPQVADAVVSLITDPAIDGALHSLVDTLFYDFFSAPGVITTISDAAGTIATAIVYGNADTVVPEVIESVRTSPDIDAGVYGSVSTAFTAFFSDAAVGQAVDSTVTTLVTNLLGDSVVQDSAGAAVAALVTGFIGDSPIAAPVGQAVGVAVEQFLATPGVAAALGAIAGSVMPDFLGQPGIAVALGDALGDLAVALVRGDDLTEATQIAVDDLKSNPEVLAAVEATIADALNQVDTTILSDPTIQQSLGDITTELIATLADDAAIQAYVAEQYGAAVAGLLTNQAVVDEISTQLGLAVTELLAYPGVSTAITDSLNLFADEYLTGTNEFVALGDALAYLQADPAFVAGVNAVIPNTVNTILADPAVLDAVGLLAKEEAIAALASFGIKNKFLGKIAGQVAEGTALSFLTRPVGLGVIDDLVVNLVLGMPLSEVESYLGHEVVYSAKVRWAVGFSVGAGIGSLFGDNIVGRLIGVAAGVPVVVTLGVTTAIERFYEWLSSGWAVSPDYSPGGAAALPNGSHYFQPVPAATDLYVMNAVLLDRQNAQAAADAVAGDGRFTLTGLTVTEPEGDQPGSLDITLSVGAADQQEGENPLALVAVSFPLDRLVSPVEAPTYARADAATVERVS